MIACGQKFLATFKVSMKLTQKTRTSSASALLNVTELI